MTPINFGGPMSPVPVYGPDSLLAPCPLFQVTGSAVFSGANQARGMRYIVPKSGTIFDLSINVAVQSGNIEVSIWDDSPTTRNALYRSGSIACPATGWQVIAATPGLVVRRGQHIDIALGCDNTTASFARTTPATSVTDLPAAMFPSPNGASGMIGWVRSTSFTAPATFLESSLSTTTNCPAVIARIA